MLPIIPNMLVIVNMHLIILWCLKLQFSVIPLGVSVCCKNTHTERTRSVLSYCLMLEWNYVNVCITPLMCMCNHSIKSYSILEKTVLPHGERASAHSVKWRDNIGIRMYTEVCTHALEVFRCMCCARWRELQDKRCQLADVVSNCRAPRIAT